MKTKTYTIAAAIVAAFAFTGNAKAYNPYSPYWFPHKTEASVPPFSKTIEVKDATVSPTWTMGFPWKNAAE